MSDLFAFGIGHATHDRAQDYARSLLSGTVQEPFSRGRARVDRAPPMTGVSSDHGRCRPYVARRLPMRARRCTREAALLLAEIDKPLTGARCSNTTRRSSSTAEAYLKLHLLSHRLALPNTLNLDGIFAQLPNVGVDERRRDRRRASSRLRSIARAPRGRQLTVHSLDKFPRMTDYVIPSGVRIADAARIRLGAYLGEGTTVMHEGFVNFNAGALGPNMVEGRISQGVIVARTHRPRRQFQHDGHALGRRQHQASASAATA